MAEEGSSFEAEKAKAMQNPYANDLDRLQKSRIKVLELADYIIPGHGKIFKVTKHNHK